MDAGHAEQARALLLELCPEGFEERQGRGPVELVAYVDAGREKAIRKVFGGVESDAVAPGWQQAWREFHRPVRVGPLWVGPPWMTPDEGALPVVIDPGQAFGTGAHATTRLCLELLLEQERCGVLDVGCGSGVLAIAAALLRFAPVSAVDRDPAAVEATRRNAAENGVAIDVAMANLLTDDLPHAGLAVANLELAQVEAASRRLRARLLIVSGYLVSEHPAPPGWIRLDRREREGWAAELWRSSGGAA